MLEALAPAGFAEGDATMSTPGSAVMSWWQSLQDKDVPALARMALDDYLSVGGPDGRRVGRDKFPAEAEQFLADAAVQDWLVTDLEVRQHEVVAVCSYRGTERGIHQD